MKTGVVGASGYTGSELVKLLDEHPTFECSLVTSRQHQGETLADLYPQLTDSVDLTFQSPDINELNQCDLLFLAVPHGTSMDIVPEIDRESTKIVDLAGDYRVNDAALFEQAYETKHTDLDNLSEAVYGLVEHNADQIKSASLVANPGCYVTSFLLPMIPLVDEGLVDPPLFVDSKSGISGAGRSPSETTTFMNVNNEVKPYNIGTHRHQTEMSFHLPGDTSLTFVPHVVSAERGIESAIYTQLSPEGRLSQARELIRGVCEDHEGLRYRETPVGMKAVAGTSYCDLSVLGDENRLVVISCLDNLRKGAASQAIQNANLMFDQSVNQGIFKE